MKEKPMEQHSDPCPCVHCPERLTCRIKDVAALFKVPFEADWVDAFRRYDRINEVNLMLDYLERRASEDCPDALLYLAEYYHRTACNVDLVQRLLNRVRAIEGPERADRLWNIWS